MENTTTTRPERRKFVVLWLLIGGVAAGACALLWPAAHLGNEYIPVSNDSFYHARRILDTAKDPSSFYQFDKKIHAPEGSLLTWPWGYDYAMGRLVRLAVELEIVTQPMAFLIWIPVAAVFLSVGLMMLLARQLSLSMWSTTIAALCVALSPLTQFLHGVGIIDHHYVEYIFVLSTLTFGLKWLLNPTDMRAAALLGLVLGIAPAVQNGLFILQVPVLATLLLLWLQHIQFPKKSTNYFCTALLASTIAILLPSLPFQLGRFEFYTLSWFHLYIAFGTAITAFFISRLQKTTRNIGLFIVTTAVLLIPLTQQVIVAHAFLAGTINRLYAISEMKSVRQMSFAAGGVWTVSDMYSLLIWLSPLAFFYCVFTAWAERKTGRLFFWISSLCGLGMLAMQFRLHYFGSFALHLPWLVMLEGVAARWPNQRKKTLLIASLFFLLLYSPSVRYQLVSPQAIAGDPAFVDLRPILSSLRQACEKEPGVVLADNDAGHYIRYYTNCSVIADNFLLTKQHEEKIEQIDHLTSLSAKALPDAAPFVRYVLLRPVNITRIADKNFSYMTFSAKSTQLLADLLLKPAADAPANYVLINQVNIRESKDSQEKIPYIRLYKIIRRN